MTILVFGKDGQVGEALRRALPDASAAVFLGRGDADLNVPGAARVVIERIRPDVVINASAYTAVDEAEAKPDLAWRINGEAVGEIAEASAATGAFLVHYSTDYVFDGSKTGEYVETDAVAPLNAYGSSKLEGERRITESGVPHYVFRTSWVHAPRHKNFATSILRLARTRVTLNVVADQFGAPTSAKLVAEVTAQLLDRRSESGVYHLAATGHTSWYDYARLVVREARASGVDLQLSEDRIVPIPAEQYPTPARRPGNSRLSTTKLRSNFGVELPPWERDVVATVHATITESPQ